MSDADRPDNGNETPNELELTKGEVNQQVNGPTEADEMEVLTDLYGPPDHKGLFTAGDPDGDE